MLMSLLLVVGGREHDRCAAAFGELDCAYVGHWPEAIDAARDALIWNMGSSDMASSIRREQPWYWPAAERAGKVRHR